MVFHPFYKIKIEKLLPLEKPALLPKDEHLGYNTIASSQRAYLKITEILLRVFLPFVAVG